MFTFPVQAHRGAGAQRPENTLESCLHTWSLSPRLIPELDISTTADGVIVAFHDHDLSRIVHNLDAALANKKLHELTWDQLRPLDVGVAMGPEFAGQRVARIADACAVMAGHPERRLYLDYKNASLPELATLVRSMGVARQVILATNNHDKIIQWQQLIADAATLLWIGNPTIEDKVQRARQKNFQGITQLQLHTEVMPGGTFAPSAQFIADLASECRTRNILLQSFLYSGLGGRCDAGAFRQLLELGVQSFATDYPQDALHAVAAFETATGVHP